MSTFTNTAREVEMPNGDVVVIHNAPTGGENTTSNIKKFKYDDNGHVTESTAADAEDLNLSGYSTPTTGTTDIGTSDDVQTAIGKLDHQSHIDQTNILLVEQMNGAKNIVDLDVNSVETVNASGLTFTIRQGIITVNGTPNRVAYIGIPFNIKAGQWFVSGCPSGGSGTSYLDDIRYTVGGSTYVPDSDIGSGFMFTVSTDTTLFYNIRIASNYTANNLVFKPMIISKAAYDAGFTDHQPYALPNYDLTQDLAELNAHPFLTVPINHNMIYRGKNLGDTLTDAQHTALSGGNFTDLYLGDYWTKTVTIPAGTYTGGDGEEVTVPEQTNITLKAVIADFDTFYAGYASSYAAINSHHAAVIVTGFNDVVWNGTNSTAGGYVNSLIHKWLVNSALPQIETWFGSAKVLSHQKMLTNAITGDAASGFAWSSQKISLLSENQVYGSKVWGNSRTTNGGYEPGEAFKHLNVFNHIDANLLFGNKNIWLRDIASAGWAAYLSSFGRAHDTGASATGIAPAELILLS